MFARASLCERLQSVDGLSHNEVRGAGGLLVQHGVRSQTDVLLFKQRRRKPFVVRLDWSIVSFFILFVSNVTQMQIILSFFFLMDIEA